MSDATDNRPDPCTLLASIEAMFAHLAERIDQDNHPNQRGIYHGEHQTILDL